MNKKFGTELFLLDEIHFYKGFASFLKRIYDFTGIKVIFTSSLALVFPELKADLSRRIFVKEMRGFTFREYMEFNHGITFPEVTMSDLLKEEFQGKECYGYEKDFKNYLKGGIFPFSLETENVLTKLQNIREVILKKDIPQLHDISIKEVQLLEDLLKFIGNSEIDGINFSSLSNNLKITKYKARQYVELLEKAFLLSVVYPKGSNVRREPKIMLSLPFRLIFTDYDKCIGQLREEYAVETMNMMDISYYYLKGSKGKKRPDYLIEDRGNPILIEIGGKGKGFSQFKGIDTAKFSKLIFSQNSKLGKFKYPLYYLGLLQ